MNQPASNLNQWFVCPQANPEADTRLFIFPYAGGGPAVFNKWPAGLPNNIEVWIAHYPGRGSRYNEHPINRLETLVESIYQAIQPLLDKPFAFFGHSMGAWVAFELTRYLRQSNYPLPYILFVSASGAPHLPDPHPPLHALADTEFLKSLQELNGIPVEVANRSEVIDLLLPTLRADIEAVEGYRYAPDGALLDVPILAYGGLDDPRVSREHLEGWASLTNASFESKYFPGDHFFINREKDLILRLITNEIMFSPTRNPRSR